MPPPVDQKGQAVGVQEAGGWWEHQVQMRRVPLAKQHSGEFCVQVTDGRLPGSPEVGHTSWRSPTHVLVQTRNEKLAGQRNAKQLPNQLCKRNEPTCCANLIKVWSGSGAGEYIWARGHHHALGTGKNGMWYVFFEISLISWYLLVLCLFCLGHFVFLVGLILGGGGNG